MKVLNGNKRMEVDDFAIYLNSQYKKCSNIHWCKGGNDMNNTWQHVILNKLVISTGVKYVG